MRLHELFSSAPNAPIKAESAPAAISYATNGFVFTYGAMTFNQMLALIAAVMAILTFAVNTYYQRRRDRREAELHYKRMRDKAAEMYREADKGIENNE